MAAQSLILDQKQLRQKIKRIAFEIYERNFRETELVLAGIDSNGYIFAALLRQEIESISGIKITLLKVKLNKEAKTQAEIRLEIDASTLKDKVIVLVDDVMNTGRVLAYALKPFLNIEVKKLQTAVLVDRSHQLFPIVSDYVGYSLATTIKEHIDVVLEGPSFGVYLH